MNSVLKNIIRIGFEIGYSSPLSGIIISAHLLRHPNKSVFGEDSYFAGGKWSSESTEIYLLKVLVPKRNLQFNQEFWVCLAPNSGPAHPHVTHKKAGVGPGTVSRGLGPHQRSGLHSHSDTFTESVWVWKFQILILWNPSVFCSVAFAFCVCLKKF